MGKSIPTHILLIILIIVGLFSWNSQSVVQAQVGPNSNGGDALWHLPQFGQAGWFLHAYNGRVRACNMDKASVVGQREAPRCSNWE